jgi:hypothetical protein
MTDADLSAALTSLWKTVDPVPPEAERQALAAIEWRDLDTALANLSSDAGVDQEFQHVRGEAPRLLSFRTASVSIELEISVTDRSVRLLGQLDPPQEATVVAEASDGSRETRADRRGRFSIDGLSQGRMRVAVAFADSTVNRTATEWFRV